MTLALHGKSPRRRLALITLALFSIILAVAAGAAVRLATTADAATTNGSLSAVVSATASPCSNLNGALGIEDGTFANCQDGQSLVLSGYNLLDDLPPGATSIGLRIGTRARVVSPTGHDTFSFELSGDGGLSYTTPVSTPDVNRPHFGEWNFFFPSQTTCGDFDHTWTRDQLSDANFRVRATADIDPTEPDDTMLLEGVHIRVCYTPPAGPDISLSAGSTSGDSVGPGEAFTWVLSTYNFPDLLGPLNLSVVVPDGFQVVGLDTTLPGFACEPPVGQEIECLAEGTIAVDRQLSVNVIAPDGTPAGECGSHTINASISGGGGTIGVPNAQHTVSVVCALVPPPPPGPLDPAQSGTVVNRKVLLGGTSNEYFPFRVQGSPPANGYSSLVASGQDHTRLMPVGAYFAEEFDISQDFEYLGSLVVAGSLAAAVCPATPPATGAGVNFTVPANGTVLVCHYNQLKPKGTIVNRKIIVGGTGDESFPVSIDPAGPDLGFFGTMKVGTDGAYSVAPGSYFVAEVLVPAGYTYLGSVVAVGNVAAPFCPEDPPSTGLGVTANVQVNGLVLVCHYNTKIPVLATATIENRKVIIGGTSGVTFSAAVDGPGGAFDYTASFTSALPHVKTVAPGNYTAIETNLPAGFEYLGAVAVPASSPDCPATPPNTGAGVSFGIAANEHLIVCHYNRVVSITTTPTPSLTPVTTPTPTTTPPPTGTPPVTNTPEPSIVPSTPEPVVKDPGAQPTPVAPSTGESMGQAGNSAAVLLLPGFVLALAGAAAGLVVASKKR